MDPVFFLIATVLMAMPARGDFTGPVNFVILILLVATPAAVALVTLAAIGCIIALRHASQDGVSKWI